MTGGKAAGLMCGLDAKWMTTNFGIRGDVHSENQLTQAIRPRSLSSISYVSSCKNA